jgi:xanthine dehydrogenase YagS FAD-binding subunit
MKPFTYERPTDVTEAIRLVSESPDAAYLAGGTNLIDLIRSGVAGPATVVDVTGLGLDAIDELGDGGIRIGAGVRNSHLAAHAGVRQHYPAVAQALLSGASGQIRNLATVGGNLLQRTRCLYFYDHTSVCNKRDRGAGCDAIGGFSRMGAILGASSACVAVNPSDLSVALAAFDAVVEVAGPMGTRRIPMDEFHTLPGQTPDLDSTLQHGELVVAVELPTLPVAANSRYRKVRDRASFAFALVSVAAALDVVDGTVREVRVALGGVAHKPWRAKVLESQLAHGPATDEAIAAAVAAELAPAKGTPDSQFKVDLARRTMVATLVRLRDEGGAA